MDETTTSYYSKQTWRTGGPLCDYASSLIELEWRFGEVPIGPRNINSRQADTRQVA
jgi:hypothetical protein